MECELCGQEMDPCGLDRLVCTDCLADIARLDEPDADLAGTVPGSFGQALDAAQERMHWQLKKLQQAMDSIPFQGAREGGRDA